jgi:serine/threonine-protein kinase
VSAPGGADGEREAALPVGAAPGAPDAALYDEPRKDAASGELPTPLACPTCERPVAEPGARFCAGCGQRFATPSLPLVEERANADPLVGRTLADRYRIEEVIGRGGMGVVYRVEHTRIGKAMAMKLLHGDLARDREIVRRFRREAETVSKLDHPNTVQIFDFGQAEGMTFLIMELLGGRDLGLILHQDGTIPFTRAAHVAIQVCGSVQQAHDRGIVHRDLKPENIRVLDDRSVPDFVKVLDFGLAKLRESNDLAGASITRQGLLVGTPYYMAPEQIRGEPSDHRADVYALGCVLYKAVAGVPPFWATSPVGVLTKHITDEAVPPTLRSPRRDLSPEVDRIVLRAMAKDPAVRYGSMKELRADLEAYLRDAGQPLPSSRRSLDPPPVESASALDLTQPLPSVPRPRAATRGGAVRGGVVPATRDEVERFERRLRAKSAAGWLVALASAGALGAGGWYAWPRSDDVRASVATAESEPNDEPATATALAPDAPLTAQIGRRLDPTHGDVDVYALEVPTGVEQISVRVSELPNLDLALDVFAQGRSDAIVVVDAMPLGGPEAAPNLPLEPGRYLLRVHEVREAGRHPIENVSDTYTVTWSPAPRAVDDEREWNDGPSQAEPVTLSAEGTARRRGFIGWDRDVDTYCLTDLQRALDVSVSAIASLDLQLTVLDEGRETLFDASPRGEGERATVPAGAGPRRLCVRVAAAPGAQRADAVEAYTLQLEPTDAP